jgi:signal transduction histidine kinase
MDIYTRKSYWKWYLAAGGALIIIISLLYTRYLADRLIEREKQQAEQFAEAMRMLAKMRTDTTSYYWDLTLNLKIIEQNTTIPVVLLNESGEIEAYRNIDEQNLDTMDIKDVQKALDRMMNQDTGMIELVFPPDIHKTLIYTHSRLLWWLELYPVLQLSLIAAFIALGYIGFSSARRAEQNQVWLGMAKETAHQLGTPITAILGWIETLKAVNEDRPDNQEMLEELRNDVTRLELVADRFSKIGALPELTPTDFYAQLEKNRDYMQRRAPRKVEFDFPKPGEHTTLLVGINAPLYDWVIENLLRNAIDSLEGGVGKITAGVYEEGKYVCLDISDTGKGIPPGKFRTVFKPGYSTKTRGWGLGLSLSKRIIEEYHRGKIFVKNSEPGKGTTFTVKMPKAK